MEKENFITFTKMHGCGNDYVFINLLEETVEHPNELAAVVSRRQKGIGSDGLVTIGPSERADFRMRIYNADGSEAEMCGNAIRCAAKYVYDRKIIDSAEISVETGAGIRKTTVFPEEGKAAAVCVDMGEPVFSAEKIPVAAKRGSVVAAPVTVGGRRWKMTCVSMGNPHAVVFADDLQRLPVERYGPLFEHQKCFPNRVNTEFVHVISRTEAAMRVWERGSGETLACGTGACAAVMACIINGFTGNEVQMHLRGGDLFIRYDPDENHVFLTGPAEEVFSGAYPGNGLQGGGSDEA